MLPPPAFGAPLGITVAELLDEDDAVGVGDTLGDGLLCDGVAELGSTVGGPLPDGDWYVTLGLFDGVVTTPPPFR